MCFLLCSLSYPIQWWGPAARDVSAHHSSLLAANFLFSAICRTEDGQYVARYAFEVYHYHFRVEFNWMGTHGLKGHSWTERSFMDWGHSWTERSFMDFNGIHGLQRYPWTCKAFIDLQGIHRLEGHSWTGRAFMDFKGIYRLPGRAFIVWKGIHRLEGHSWNGRALMNWKGIHGWY